MRQSCLDIKETLATESKVMVKSLPSADLTARGMLGTLVRVLRWNWGKLGLSVLEAPSEGLIPPRRAAEPAVSQEEGGVGPCRMSSSCLSKIIFMASLRIISWSSFEHCIKALCFVMEGH